jgi:hypothetical protein
LQGFWLKPSPTGGRVYDGSMPMLSQTDVETYAQLLERNGLPALAYAVRVSLQNPPPGQVGPRPYGEQLAMELVKLSNRARL